MDTPSFNLIDSHLHLDHLIRFHPQQIVLMRERRCIPISWAFSDRIDCTHDLEDYFKSQAQTLGELAESGFPCHYLVGIHPRNIPRDLKPEAVGQIITPFLESSQCLGIGEVGLETGSSEEIEAFLAQIQLALELHQKPLRVGIHTPRNNKRAITKKTLSLLRGFNGIETISVIDHCNSTTLIPVLESGFHAGITLSPSKVSLQELKMIVDKHPNQLDRIMCNTDSGTTFSEDLYRFFNSAGFSHSIRRKMTFENAFRFFQLSK
jgi:predicted metal-dependent TIM-barrel fold hydrolase